MLACAATQGCVAFTFDGKCGFLKSSAAATKSRGGWMLFVKA
jgi:hypothetical protein